jgi:hypothetical protein
VLEAKNQGFLKDFQSTHDLGLLLMRKTGLRVGELSLLSFRCLRQDARGLYFLKVPLGKLNNERLVPLSQGAVQLVQIIERLTRDKPKSEPKYLLASRKRSRVSECMVRIRFIRMLKEIAHESSEYVHPHWFRHTYATELLSAGIRLPVVMQFLRHLKVSLFKEKDLAVTRQVESIDRILRSISGIGNPGTAVSMVFFRNVRTNFQLKYSDELAKRQQALDRQGLKLNIPNLASTSIRRREALNFVAELKAKRDSLPKNSEDAALITQMIDKVQALLVNLRCLLLHWIEPTQEAHLLETSVGSCIPQHLLSN